MKLSESILTTFKKLIPNLSAKTKKGDSGRIAVVGGNPMYTGAPYHAAITQLRAVR